ncbi:MAG TPA: (2Fe-2S)-binding protein [Candidatus Limnocylindria bacterium]|nr:(2Fe-2S)-binding protein [Candidatus Limnocylindria bacterium]
MTRADGGADLAPLPAWDRLAVRGATRLAVAPLQRVSLEELLIRDDDLPGLDGATVIWAWPAEADWWVRAVRIHGASATPILVRARRLRVERPDPALARLLGFDPDDPPSSVSWGGEPRLTEPMPRQLACICRMTTGQRVYRAIEAGWRTVDEVKRATEAGFGVCQGRRCVAGLAARLDLDGAERRAMITPRPPLVPVPASVLAAFAEG